MWTLFLTLAHGCEPDAFLATDGRCSRARLAWSLPEAWKVEQVLHPEPNTLWLLTSDPEHHLAWHALDLVTGGLGSVELPTEGAWPVPFAGGMLVGDRRHLYRYADGTWNRLDLPEGARRLQPDGDGLITTIGSQVLAFDGAVWAPLGELPAADPPEHLFRVDGALHACGNPCLVLRDGAWSDGPSVPDGATTVASTAEGHTWAQGGGEVWKLVEGAFVPLQLPTRYGSSAITPWGLHYAGDGKLFVHDGQAWQLREHADYAHERLGPDDWVSLQGVVHLPGSAPFGVDTSVVAAATVPGGGLLLSGGRGLAHLDASGRMHAVERPGPGELEVAVFGEGTWIALDPETREVWLRQGVSWTEGPMLPLPIPRRGAIEPWVAGVAGDRLAVVVEDGRVASLRLGEAGWALSSPGFQVSGLHGIEEPDTGEAPAGRRGIWALGEGGQTAVLGASGTWEPSVRFGASFERRAVLQLRGGEVLVVGGRTPAAQTGTVETELCRPLESRCRPGPSLPTEVYGGTLVELADGRVVLLGGDRSRVYWLDPPLDQVPAPVDTTSLDWLEVNPFAWDSIRVVEPSRWVEGAPLREKGAHRYGASVLADGRVAVLGSGLGPPLQLYDAGGPASPLPALPRDRVRDLTEAYCLAGHSQACAQLPATVRSELAERFP